MEYLKLAEHITLDAGFFLPPVTTMGFAGRQHGLDQTVGDAVHLSFAAAGLYALFEKKIVRIFNKPEQSLDTAPMKQLFHLHPALFPHQGNG